jgi:putative membrane protein insertion efficiency factor
MTKLAITNLAGRILIGLIEIYRLGISPWLGRACRFEPSCSAYAQDAILMHGALGGGWLSLKRLARCHPWGGNGYDPVPKRPHDRTCRRVSAG